MARFTVLVLGGTGVFGSRISRRLAAGRAKRRVRRGLVAFPRLQRPLSNPI